MVITDVGYAALLIAFIVAGFSAIAFAWGKIKGYAELLESGRNGVYAVCGLLTIASLIMFYSLLTHDFQVKYIAEYTSLDLDVLYVISAFWAGQEGSLLFWAWLLSI